MENTTYSRSRNERNRVRATLKPALRLKTYKPENLFLRLILVFGFLTIFLMPIFQPPDEVTHFSHAYFIFHQETQVSTYTDVRNEVDPLVNEIPAAYTNGTFWKTYYLEDASFAGQNPLGLSFSFQSIQWLPQAIGIAIGAVIHPSLGIMVLFGRLVNLLFYALDIYFCIKKAKFGKLPMAVVALLPIAIQQASSLSYDVPFFISIFWAFSLLTNLWLRKEKLTWSLLLNIGLLTVFILAVKPSALLLGLYFITLPTALFGSGLLSKALDRLWRFFENHRLVMIVLGIFLFLAFIQLAFAAHGGLLNGLQILFNTLFRSDIYKDLDSVLVSGSMGNFGPFAYRLPEWIIVLDFIFLALVMLNQQKVALEHRIVITSGLIFSLNIIAVAVIMYLTYTISNLNQPNAIVSLGSQGRYYTPFFLAFIPIGAGARFRRFIQVTIPERNMYKWTRLFLWVNFVFFIALTLLYYYTPAHGAYFLTHL